MSHRARFWPAVVALLLVASVVGGVSWRLRTLFVEGRTMLGWVEQLRHCYNRDEGQRIRSVLRRFGPAVVPRLLEIKPSDGRLACSVAVAVLGDLAISTPEVARFLLGSLTSSEEETRASAMAALRRMGAAAVPVLSASLQGRPFRCPEDDLVLQVLVEIGEPAVPALVDLAREERREVGLAVRQSLVKLSPAARKEAAALLGATLREAGSDERSLILWSLAEMEAEADEVLPELCRCLEDPECEVRNVAVMAISTVGKKSPQAVAALVRVLDGPDTDLQCAALRGLGRLGRSTAGVIVPVTRKLLDIEPSVRAAAADALGQIGPAAGSAISWLLPLVHDYDSEVRKTAIAALGKLQAHGPQVVSALLDVLRGEDGQLTKEVYLLLPRVADSTCGPLLIESLDDGSEGVRVGALMALVHLPEVARDTLPRLRLSLRREAHGTQEQVALVMAGCGPAALPELIAALYDPDPAVRACALLGLGAVAAPAPVAIPHVLPFLRDKDDRVRELAGTAVSRLEPIPVLLQAHLAPLLHDPVPRIQFAAQLALDRSVTRSR
jgi:HEAT repeat protein